MKAQTLAAGYRLIGELFLYPEDRDKDRIDAGLRALKGAPQAAAAAVEAFLAEPSASATEEYVATLELAPPCPLYLGAYLYDEPDSCRGAGMSGRNGYMLELSNAYRHFGIELTGSEMADFLPVVLEFLAHSLAHPECDRIGLRRYVVESHVLNAVEEMLSRLRKYESPYALLIDALRVLLTEDMAGMTAQPRWQPSANDEGPSLPYVEAPPPLPLTSAPVSLDVSTTGIEP